MDATGEGGKTGRGTRRVWLWSAAGVAGLVVLGAGLVWTLRGAIAEKAVHDWCVSEELICALDIASLGFDRVRIENLRVASAGGVPLEAAAIEASLTWPGLLRPDIGTVRIEGGVVRARYGETGLDLFGLERFAVASGETPARPAPAIAITDLRVEIDTSAGPLTGQVSAEGRFPTSFRLSAALDPTRFSQSGDHLVLDEGRFQLVWEEGLPSGEGVLRLSRAEIDGLAAEDVRLSLQASSRPQGAGFTVQSEGSAALLAIGPRRAESLRFAFEASTVSAFPKPGPRGIGDLGALNLSAEMFALDAPEGSAAHMLLDLDLTGENGRLKGPVLVSAEGLVTPRAAFQQLNLDGDADIAAEGDRIVSAAWSGSAVAREASLGQSLRTAIMSMIALPQPLDAHAGALADALNQALSRFDTGLVFAANWSQDGTIRLDGRRASRFSAASGLTISLTPRDESPWLSVTPDLLRVSGDVSLSGGGLPDIAASLSRFELPLEQEGGFAIEAAPAVIGAWTVGGLTVGFDAEAFSFAGEPGSRRAFGRGELSLDGIAYGLEVDKTSLFGGFRAVEGVEGWRIVMDGTDCLALASGGLKSGEFAIDAFAVSACPDEGRLLRREGDAFVGTASLGDTRFALSTPNLDAALSLTAGQAAWSLTDRFTVTLTADRLDAPVTLPSGGLRLAARAPRLGLDLRPDAPRIDASLTNVDLSGSLVPARVRARSLSFSGSVEKSGINGKGRYEDVIVSDLNPDPIYQPLNVGGDFTLRRGKLTSTGAVRLNKGGTALADARLDLDLLTLTGGMTLTGEMLTFRRGGLQPAEISDRVRGLFSNATGSVRPQADLFFRGGDMSGTGEIVLDGLDFDTFRVGSVRGLSGRIVFDDLVGLRTLPDQRLTIAELNPGIPLSDGELVFQVLGASEAHLERAAWPLAGGELRIQPADWKIGGDTDTVIAEMRDIDLSALVKLLNVPDLDVSGTASGHFPVVIRGADILIENAVLTVDTGGGVLRYTGPAGDLAGQSSEEARMTFDALRNFQFTVLSLSMNGNVAGNITIGVHLIGRNPDVMQGQLFDLNIGVESPLVAILQTGARALTGSSITDAAAELARRKKEGGDPQDGQ